jgi:hypothetical protein
MIGKLVSVLETTLSKLSRYDEGSLIGSILSFTVCSLMTETFQPDNIYTLLISYVYCLDCSKICLINVGFEVLTAMLLKVKVFWDVTLCHHWVRELFVPPHDITYQKTRLCSLYHTVVP